MAGFFLGRWLRLGRSLVGQGFGGLGLLLADDTEASLSAAVGDAVVLAACAADETATSAAVGDVPLSSQVDP